MIAVFIEFFLIDVVSARAEVYTPQTPSLTLSRTSQETSCIAQTPRVSVLFKVVYHAMNLEFTTA